MAAQVTELTIQGLDAELVTIEAGKDVHAVQFRFRTVDEDCFTYQVEVSESAFVSANGYRGNHGALLEDAQSKAHEHLVDGRFKDLLVVRLMSGWMQPIALPDTLRKHSSHYDGA